MRRRKWISFYFFNKNSLENDKDKNETVISFEQKRAISEQRENLQRTKRENSLENR